MAREVIQPTPGYATPATIGALVPYAHNPTVIAEGAVGAWDEFIREIGNILYDATEPVRKYQTWYSGYSPPYDDEDVYIGYAYSSDGITWTKIGQVTVRAAEDPHVVKADDTYYMYVENSEDRGVEPMTIRVFTSPDGETWTDQGDALEPEELWEVDALASPTVWIEDGIWYMLYEGFTDVTGTLIACTGLATSADGLTWVKNAANPVFSPTGNAGDFDAHEAVPDDIVKIDTTYYLFYHGIDWDQLPAQSWEHGIATSTDLVTWTRVDRSPFRDPLNGPMFYYDTQWVAHCTVGGYNGPIGRYYPAVDQAEVPIYLPGLVTANFGEIDVVVDDILSARFMRNERIYIDFPDFGASNWFEKGDGWYELLMSGSDTDERAIFDRLGNLELALIVAARNAADYTAFTHVGAVGVIGVSDVAFDLIGNADEYLYADLGAGYFPGDFRCYLSCLLDSGGTNFATSVVWGVSNTIGDVYSWWLGTLDGLAVVLYDSSGCIFILRNCADHTTDSSAALSYDTRYYLTITRLGATTTCKIYSDAARTILVDTLTVTEATAASYQYLYALSSWNVGAAATGTGDVWNLIYGKAAYQANASCEVISDTVENRVDALLTAEHGAGLWNKGGALTISTV